MFREPVIELLDGLFSLGRLRGGLKLCPRRAWHFDGIKELAN